MSKKKRQLLVILAVVVVLGALVAVLTLLPSGDPADASSDSPSSTASTAEVTLYSRDKTDLKKLVLTNEFGTFTLTAKPDGDAMTYALEGYEGLNVSTAMLSSIAEFGSKLVVYREIGDTTDLASYGLTKPAAEFTAEYTDGSSVSIQVGDPLPTDASRRYAVEKGKKNVFVVSANSLTTVKNTALLSTSLINAAITDNNGESAAPSFDSIHISGRGHESKISIYPTSKLNVEETSPLKVYSYYIDGRAKVPLYSSATEKYLLDMCTVTASDLAVINPTDAQKAEYGFDDPIILEFTTVETDDNDKKTLTPYKLLIGRINDDGTAYAMLEDVNIIYTVPADKLAVATMSVFELRDSLLNLVSVSSVEEIVVQIGDQTYKFDHERKERETSSGASSTSSVIYDYETYYNGELLSSFSKYYQQFLSAYKQEPFTEADQKGDLLFTITLKHYPENTKKETVFKVYDCVGNDRRVVYEVDGEIIGLAKKSWASKLIDDTDRLLKGEEITVTE